jgi:hypothetical protein
MADKDKKQPPRSGSVQPPLDGELSKFLESEFRVEQPQSIDVFPLAKNKRDRLTRLHHYDVRPNEKIGAERSVELANIIFSKCQNHCDTVSKGEAWTFEVSLIDERRGGLAHPVGIHCLTLMPRPMRPGRTDDSGEDEDEEGVSAKGMMLTVFKEIVDKDDRREERAGKIAGDMLLLGLKREEALMGTVNLLVDKVVNLVDKVGDLALKVNERRVEERAIGIEEADHAEDRKDRAARRERENMTSDLMRGLGEEGIKALGQLIPGFGAALLSRVAGRDVPINPPLADGGQPTMPKKGDQPQLPAIPEEKQLVDRFIEAAEAKGVDEALFGEDDRRGNTIKPGIFTRPQVAILTGVHTGTLGVDALDALLADSGKPEAVTASQMARAFAYLTPDMVNDVARFMELRTQAKK